MPHDSNSFMLNFLLMVVLSCVASRALAAPGAASETVEISTRARDGQALTAEAILRKDGGNSGLVIVVPGSGGLEDPYFDFDFEAGRGAYDSMNRGGLTKALLESGFAVAYFSQRGYRRLASCMDDKAGAAKAFATHCVDQNIRGKVDLDTITADVGYIVRAIAGNPRFATLPIVVLAYSEGMYHTAKVIREGPIQNLIGVVSIGGPPLSIADTVKYQITHRPFLDAVSRAFLQCKSPTLSVDDVMRCTRMRDSDEWRSGILATMGKPTFDQSDLVARSEFWQADYQRAVRFFKQDLPDGTMGATIAGAPITVNWSARYFAQMLHSNEVALELLKGFRGRVVFLLGQQDSLVQIPSQRDFARLASENGVAASLEVVPDVNHILADGTGAPPAEAFSRILASLKRVFLARKSPGVAK